MSRIQRRTCQETARWSGHSRKMGDAVPPRKVLGHQDQSTQTLWETGLYKFHGHTLEVVDNGKYLGVNISNERTLLFVIIAYLCIYLRINMFKPKNSPGILMLTQRQLKHQRPLDSCGVTSTSVQMRYNNYQTGECPKTRRSFGPQHYLIASPR